MTINRYEMCVQDQSKSTYHFILLLIMIFISDDTITFGPTEDKSLLFVKYVVYLLLLIILPLTIKSPIFSINIFKYPIIIVSTIIISAITNYDITGGYVYQIWVVTLAYFIVNKIDLADFARLFNKIMYLLCIVSLVIFTIANSFSWILSYFPIHENISGTQLINLYLGAVYSKSNDIRNMGIFREPGVYMVYILIGIIFELYYFTLINIKRVFAYILTLVTTFSTAAFIVAVFVVTGYYFNKSKLKSKYKILITLFILTIFAAVYLNPELYDRVFSKLEVDSASYGSALAREASVIINYQIFSDNILAGAGLNPYVELFESYSAEHYGVLLNANSQSTNTYMSIYATYGLIFGTVVVSGIYSFTKRLSKSTFSHIMLFLSFILLFSNEDMRYSLLFNVMLFYGFKYTTIKSNTISTTVTT